MSENAKTVATFSIVAFDPETDSLGVAVQSTFLAVGALVPYARAGVGGGGDAGPGEPELRTAGARANGPGENRR